MRITKRPRQVTHTTPDDSPDDVRLALKALTRFFKRGQESLRSRANAKPNAKVNGNGNGNGNAESGTGGSKDDEPKTYNAGPQEMLRKARVLARDDSPDEFDRLVSFARDRGFPLGVSHVIRLVSVPASDRRVLEREMILHRWSHAQLEAEIRRRYGNRRPAVGRPQEPPRDARAAMVKTAKLCEHWRRFLRSLAKPTQRKSAQREPQVRRDVPKPVRDRLAQVSRAMARLERTVKAELTRAGVK